VRRDAVLVAAVGLSFRSGALLLLGLGAGLELDLPLRSRPALFDLGAALTLGIELMPEENRQVSDPEPDQQDYQAGERAVGLVVGAEVGDIEGEGGRGNRPDDDRHQAPGVAHLKPRSLAFGDA
jgi:hypothetical protein